MVVLAGLVDDLRGLFQVKSHQFYDSMILANNPSLSNPNLRTFNAEDISREAAQTLLVNVQHTG